MAPIHTIHEQALYMGSLYLPLDRLHAYMNVLMLVENLMF